MGFIETCSNKGFLMSDKVVLDGLDCDKFLKYIDSLPMKPLVIDQKIIENYKSSSSFFNANLGGNEEVIVSKPKVREKTQSSVEVINNFKLNNKLRSMNDWFDYYLNRYNVMKKLLENRRELKNSSSVSSIKKMVGKNEVSTIGLVKDIHKTSNDNIIIQLEDPTGVINAFVSSSKQELVKQCEDIVNDEIIGVCGNNSSNFLYINELVFPGIPDTPITYGEEDEYACFIADIHMGSIDFEKKMFENFSKWLKGESGTEAQKQTARKVKYLFVVGDIVDGVGIYPTQEKELEIKDIYKQYETVSDYFKGLPEDLQLIFIPGNHDALRQSEPQPPLFEDIAKPIYELSNVRNLSNPSTVNIGKTPDFKGFNVLLYHGFSYTYYANTVPKLLNVGMDKPDLISEFLLKKRHLGPSHTSGLITPEALDPLVIETIPDIIATGHIHTLGYKKYKATNIIATSCFQKMTSFMQKLGHHPTPGFVPLLNLKTREVKVMDFTK